jgi:large subunit ribosomal protein L22
MKAMLKNYRQSPRKVRLVCDLIKGKSIANAKTELAFLPRRASLPITKLIDSAVANAKTNNGIEADKLIIESVTVNKGLVMKRFMPRARGSASRINKRTSHVLLTLKEGTQKGKKSVKAKPVKTEKKAVAKTTKKVSVKKAEAKEE